MRNKKLYEKQNKMPYLALLY